MKKAKNFNLNEFIVNVFEPTEKGLSKDKFQPIDLIYSMKEMLKDSIGKLKIKIASENKISDEKYLQTLSSFYIDMLTTSCHIVIKSYSHDTQNNLYHISNGDIIGLTNKFTEIIKLKFEYPLLEEIFIDSFILTQVNPIINAIRNRKSINKQQAKTQTRK